MTPLRRLRVEGSDDETVINHLLDQHPLKGTFDLDSLGSIDEVLKDFSVQLKSSGPYRYGIVVDADSDFERVRRRIAERLRQNGFQEPLFGGEGIILDKDPGIKVGVWVMPDNTSHGTLESFLQSFVPPGDPLFKAIDDHLTEYENGGLVGYIPNKRPKALIHSWLACQREPGSSIELALKRKYLNPHNEQAQLFISWINELFFSEPQEEK